MVPRNPPGGGEASTTIYLSDGFDAYADPLGRLGRLGKHTTGRACLYVKRLADIDPVVLEELLTRSVAHVRASNG